MQSHAWGGWRADNIYSKLHVRSPHYIVFFIERNNETSAVKCGELNGLTPVNVKCACVQWRRKKEKETIASNGLELFPCLSVCLGLAPCYNNSSYSWSALLSAACCWNCNCIRSSRHFKCHNLARGAGIKPGQDFFVGLDWPGKKRITKSFCVPQTEAIYGNLGGDFMAILRRENISCTGTVLGV